MDKIKTSCHIINNNGLFIANIYNEAGVHIVEQPHDSRAILTVDGEPVTNDRFGKPFDSEDHVREWISTGRDGEDVEYIDEPPTNTVDDEETPIDA